METVPELEQVLKLGDMEEIDYIVNRAIGNDKKAQESKNLKLKTDFQIVFQFLIKLLKLNQIH